MKSAVDIFAQLGERLADFGEDARSSAVIAEAVDANGWFTPEDIRRAVGALRTDMLQAEALRRWLAEYDVPCAVPKRVAVVMAGNIPLVGFYDLMCVVASGHTAVVKPSGKDRVLVEYVVELLRGIEPSVRIELCDNDSLGSADADAVIATGNDNARRYFKAAYRGKPQLLRGNRHSVAVLSGRESAAEIEGLHSDMFAYSGLGCRSVSMIFVPRGCGLHLHDVPQNAKYRNNYRQTRAMLAMSGAEFVDAGVCLLTAGDDFPQAVSCVTLYEYDDLHEVAAWLEAHDGEVQCVVSSCLHHPRGAAFGQAQHPSLHDAPDAVDVMAFLASL